MINVRNLIKTHVKDLNPKNILDLGCGSGKVSSIFFEKEVIITGVDKNKQNIDNEKFTFIHKDVENFNFENKYDMIIMSLILHFLNKEKAIEIIKQSQKYTEIGGYNLVICLSEKDDLSKKEKYYPSLEEIKELYSGWKIIKYVQDFTSEEKHNDLDLHKHNIIFMLAEKIN